MDLVSSVFLSLSLFTTFESLKSVKFTMYVVVPNLVKGGRIPLLNLSDFGKKYRATIILSNKP